MDRYIDRSKDRFDRSIDKWICFDFCLPKIGINLMHCIYIYMYYIVFYTHEYISMKILRLYNMRSQEKCKNHGNAAGESTAECF